MLDKATASKLRELKLSHMAKAFSTYFSDQLADGLSFEERFSMLVDAECDARRANRLKRYIREAGYACPGAALEDVDYRPERGLNKEQITRLATCHYLAEHHNIILVGATGSGKTYLACAFGMAANRQLIPTRYIRLPDLLGELAAARGMGNYKQTVRRYQRIPLLILDEWLLYPLNNSDTAELMELIEHRHQHTSTIFCSQVDSCDWVPRLGSEVIVAEAICDRFVHDAYRIVVHGDSMRKLNGIAAKEA